jgi:hypothetical protein
VPLRRQIFFPVVLDSGNLHFRVAEMGESGVLYSWPGPMQRWTG